MTLVLGEPNFSALNLLELCYVQHENYKIALHFRLCGCSPEEREGTIQGSQCSWLLRFPTQ